MINPNRSNIPGLEALKTADLMVIFTRFRNLPDEQMKHDSTTSKARSRSSASIRRRTPSAG